MESTWCRSGASQPGHDESAIFDHTFSHDGNLRADVDAVRADIGANLVARLHSKQVQGVAWEYQPAGIIETESRIHGNLMPRMGFFDKPPVFAALCRGEPNVVF